ncbi:hypothetical protein Pcinc_013952 [Petrolisthes cinctipes]|uniref:Uncharacterized protein n=1 Tax=Petrolisthes cinctipes TaxID=88211 RepID=A0AAE1FXK1_PETCI|nr:hypothetical protein Pcinc_013952 [Petrolisthes cinctipes]
MVAVNVNGMVEKTKRREIVECFKNGGVDVMGVTKTHLKGWGVEECEAGGESVMWEGMEGGVVWTGMSEKCKGRGREWCAVLVAPRVWKRVDGHGWCGTRVAWMTGKIGLIKYAWVCAYAPVNERNKAGREKMRVFWEKLNGCLRKFETGRKIVMMGDMNGKVGNERVGSIVGKWGVE